MSRRILTMLPLLAAPALGGCIHLLPSPPPPPHLYVLEAGAVAHAAGAPIDAVIAVSNPDGERAELGSDVIWRTGDTLAYVAATQWSSRAEDALQSMLTQTLAQQGRFKAAVESGGARADFEVRWNITDFEVVDAGGSMTARFHADVSVVEAAGRVVVAAQSFTTQVPVSDRSASAATRALTQAARDGSVQIAAFAWDAATAAIAREQAEQAARDAARAAQTQQTGTPSASRPVTSHHRRRH